MRMKNNSLKNKMDPDEFAETVLGSRSTTMAAAPLRLSDVWTFALLLPDLAGWLFVASEEL